MALSALAAGPSFLTSHYRTVTRPLKSVGSPAFVVAAMFEEDALLDRRYLEWLELTVNDMAKKLGMAVPERPTGHLSVQDHVWIDVLEQKRQQLERRRQLELYVQRLEQQLLSLSTSYEVVDAVCNVPYPGRATDEAYVAALEEAVATLEGKFRPRGGESSLEW